jgi:hypothetical protein
MTKPLPVLLESIDLHIEPHFELSIVTDDPASIEPKIERIYRCTVGAGTMNEAYEKLRTTHGFSWWIAEHAYKDGPLFNQEC